MIANFGERAWHLASAFSLLVSLPCLIFGLLDAAFVVATLGVVAHFLGLRQRCRAALIEAERAEAMAADRLVESVEQGGQWSADHRSRDTANDTTRVIRGGEDRG